MTTWREQEEDAPVDFLNLLVKKEIQSESEYSDEDDDLLAPPYSPLSSPRQRERSRSPVWQEATEFAPVNAIIEIFDENGRRLDTDGDIDVNNDSVLPPDADVSIFSPNGEEKKKKKILSGRIEKRGTGRGQKTRARAEYRVRTVLPRWELGQPLTEVWRTDDDLPAEMVSLLIDANDKKMKEKIKNRRNRDDNEEGDSDEFDADDGTSSLFEWSSMESFQGKEECFLPKRTGATRIHESAYDAFRSYWDDDIIDIIVSETNQYACNITSPSFRTEWIPTNSHEILCLFAFWMMIGIIRMPTIISCFSTDPLLKTEVFKRIFTRRRYEFLSRALHFMDVATANTDDRLRCIRPIISHLNASFQSNYILSQNICIDESLTLWKGSLDIKQYIRSKAAKFGIKTFELCESTTGYMWSFMVYTGKHSADMEQAPGVYKSTAIVKKLIAPLLNKGHRLFMDNWFNSPHLARFLKRNHTDCVGTLRQSRRDVPNIISKPPLKRGDIIARHSGDVTVFAWQDKKRVTMISTCHGASSALPRVPSKRMSRPIPFKPHAVLDYNKFMGGVDLKDQMLEPYLLERKKMNKWYMKLFKRLLNVSILNSRILLQSSLQKPQDHLAFRLQLVDSILSRHRPHCPLNRSRYLNLERSQRQALGKHIPGAHWPTLLPQFDEKTRASTKEKCNRRRRISCAYCLRQGRKNSKTTFCCETCLVPLCLRDCFKLYHTS